VEPLTLKHSNQHGNFQLTWKGSVLLAEYEGVWNEIAARNMHQQAKILWELQEKGPWALISDASKWDGATLATLDLWWIFFEDAVAHGLAVVTDILPSQFHAAMVSPLAERASKIAKYRCSKDLDDAYTWLEKEGFNSR
jgi:hypothetical protein